MSFDKKSVFVISCRTVYTIRVFFFRLNRSTTRRMKMMKELAIAALAAGGVCAADAEAWDKTFPKSDKVEHAKVTFKNRFGITLAADVYKPKVGNEKFAAKTPTSSRLRSQAEYRRNQDQDCKTAYCENCAIRAQDPRPVVVDGRCCHQGLYVHLLYVPLLQQQPCGQLPQQQPCGRHQPLRV